MNNIRIVERPDLGNAELNNLFEHAWTTYKPRDFAPVFAQSLTYFAAFAELELVGFVNVAWDGGAHAFLLDPTVHPQQQRQGIGSALVLRAIAAARDAGVEWVHVDYEAHLASFYAAVGFQPTNAVVLRVDTSQ